MRNSTSRVCGLGMCWEEWGVLLSAFIYQDAMMCMLRVCERHKVMHAHLKHTCKMHTCNMHICKDSKTCLQALWLTVKRNVRLPFTWHPIREENHCVLASMAIIAQREWREQRRGGG